MGCCESTSSTTNKKKPPLSEAEIERLNFKRWYEVTQCGVPPNSEEDSIEDRLGLDREKISKALFGQVVTSVGVVCVARKVEIQRSSGNHGNPLAAIGNEDPDLLHGNSPRPIGEDEEEEESAKEVRNKKRQKPHNVQEHHHDLIDEKEKLVGASIFYHREAALAKRRKNANSGKSGKLSEQQQDEEDQFIFPVKDIETEQIVLSMVSSAAVAQHRSIMESTPLPPWNFISYERELPATTSTESPETSNGKAKQQQPAEGANKSNNKSSSISGSFSVDGLGDEDETKSRFQLSLLKLSRDPLAATGSSFPLAANGNAGKDEKREAIPPPSSSSSYEIVAEYLAVESHTPPGAIVGGLGLIPSTRWADRLNKVAPGVTENVFKLF